LPRQETVPSFDSVDDLQHALERKASFEQCDLYPRDGQTALGHVEEIIAEVNGVKSNQAMLFNSGMSAIDTVLEAAVGDRAYQDLKLIHTPVLYSQTYSRLEKLAKSGVKVLSIGGTQPDDIAEAFERHKPDIFLGETIGNGPGVPVLDVNHLLKLNKEQSRQATILLDNTLPLSTGIDISKKISKNSPVVVIESGTKSYTQNAELSGIAFTKDGALARAIKLARQQKGSNPGVGSAERIKLLLPESRRAFDERNNRIFKNSSVLATILHQIAEERKDFIVSHPNLQGHPGNKIIKRQKIPFGGSPILFLEPKSFSDGDQILLTEEIWENPDVRQHSDLGQSFCFDRTRILYDERFIGVRISAGAETDTGALGEAFKRALL
jgi:cystathionine beta-lyase/cystathionine gamma-synthase